MPSGDDDFVVLHLGTVCSRKGQVFSATACAKLIQDGALEGALLFVTELDDGQKVKPHDGKIIIQV